MQRERKIDLFDNLEKHGKLRRVGEVVKEAEKQKRGKKYNKMRWNNYVTMAMKVKRLSYEIS